MPLIIFNTFSHSLSPLIPSLNTCSNNRSMKETWRTPCPPLRLRKLSFGDIASLNKLVAEQGLRPNSHNCQNIKELRLRKLRAPKPPSSPLKQQPKRYQKGKSNFTSQQARPEEQIAKNGDGDNQPGQPREVASRGGEEHAWWLLLRKWPTAATVFPLAKVNPQWGLSFSSFHIPSYCDLFFQWVLNYLYMFNLFYRWLGGDLKS